MKTIVLEPNVRKTLARAGDTGVMVQMDALAWHTAYPAGTPELMVTAPGGTRWPVTVAYADGKISGEVPDELMVRPGLYSYTFAWISAGEQVRSSPCGAIILASETTKRWDPHSKAPDWADRIFLAAETIEAGFDGATEAADLAISAKDTAVDAKDTAEDAKDAALEAQEAAEAARDVAETHNYGISVSSTTLVITPPVND
jgi:hypothetical protein